MDKHLTSKKLPDKILDTRRLESIKKVRKDVDTPLKKVTRKMAAVGLFSKAPMRQT